MTQRALFHDSIADALRAVIAAAGGTKTVGARMRPELPADHAGRWLSDCLNDSRREHLAPDQVMFLLRLGREVGAHDAIDWIAAASGYAAPSPISPDDERAQLMRDYVEAAKGIARMAERIERLHAAPDTTTLRRA